MKNNKSAIEVIDLVTHYGPREILHGINLSINEDEIMIIMGGSGSGKSTLLRYLLGLGTPTSGNINLLGKDITKINNKDSISSNNKLTPTKLMLMLKVCIHDTFIFFHIFSIL